MAELHITRATAAIVAVVGVASVVAILGIATGPRAPNPLAFSTQPVSTFSVDLSRVPDGPISAYGFSVADDIGTQRVLLFGGVDSWDQTWLWDGTRWTRARPAISPPGRALAAAAYDSESGELLLFGGRNQAGQTLGDTWAWEGASWTLLSTGDARPSAGAQMGWDAALGEMVLVTPRPGGGGETWAWFSHGWIREPQGDLPASPIGGGIAFDPATRSLIFASPLLPPSGAGTTTWRWDGISWHRLPAPTPTATIGLALDPATRHLELCSDAGAGTSPHLWAWTGSRWSAVPRSDLPVQLGAEVSDSTRSRLLVFGFVSPSSAPAPQPVRVWSWDGHGWTQSE